MKINKPKVFLWLVLILGFLFDFLFVKKTLGISFFIFVMLVVISGLYLAKIENKKPNKTTLYLLIPIFYFSIMSFVRAEPMTTFLNYALTIVLLGIFANSFLGGKWFSYGIIDYFLGAVNLGFSAITRQSALINTLSSKDKAEGEQPTKRRKIWSYVRGLALAIPIVYFFSSLLTSADPVFAQEFEEFFKIFKIENLGEYISRSILILIIAYLIAGIFMHAFYKNHDEKLNKNKIPSFLGFTETSIILGSVNILFLSFVIVQFQYFFGGKANVVLEGYTYAEYAQRGFAELVAVAVFSLLLFIGLSSISKKQEKNKQNIFSGMGIALFLLIGVILVSALQRMLIYEEAYGFTRLRTYTHVFIIWLAILLAGIVILEIIKMQKYFTLFMMVAAIGFAASLNLLNVDAFITNMNFSRFESGEELDIGHLASLSEDMLPTIFTLYSDQEDFNEEIGGVISCHAERNQYYNYSEKYYSKYDWRSFQFARYWAENNWNQQLNKEDSSAFENNIVFDEDEYYPYVFVNNEKVSCWEYAFYD
ncbi:MAG: DUF4173 domain-containing protein [Chloroflexi bacterium]|jgi:hypothetical protein|nr:DUF4173 domain-containing protein [Chloroflexota bacterium]MBT3669494.1 DUF4173 domain-containing protein [Chloroflexota bacterium]MBT4002431.1 DUF4173 domain-containing protein [Chloroflexota bacterium]MBT4534172.1 DUF4173 domain-containing protein [Chloroflexota bacterium]MBT4683391.1 DUF4173 domain-containing protein [Chloroflexota bacterium]